MKVKSMDGSLCLIAKHWKVGVVDVVDIWIMEESWTKLVSVNQSMFTSPFKVVPLAFSKNGDRVLLSIDKKKFGWYDLSSKRVNTVTIEGVPSLFKAEMLVESLVPLNANGEIINNKEHGKEKQRKEEHQEVQVMEVIEKAWKPENSSSSCLVNGS